MFEKKPECPGNREDYIWVDAKKGGHWRKKRGSIKKAVLNPVFAKNARLTSLTNKASGQIIQLLHLYLNGIKKGDFYSRLAGRLKKAYNQSGELDFSFTQEMNVQDEYPLEKLLIAGYRIENAGKRVGVRIPIDDHTVKQHSELVTNYYFELLIVYGDAGSERGLYVDDTSSSVYPINSVRSADCVMLLDVPDAPWMLILKVTCIEGNELAYSYRNFGMKVVATGG